MDKIILVLISLTILQSCKKDENQTYDERKLFADTEAQIKKYREDAQKYWDLNDAENAMKYDDSIKLFIRDSYIDNYKFITVDSSIYNTSKRKKPLFLQVTASWCAPCKFEVPSLNKIVEKYSDKVDFVLLFWDSQKELEKLAQDYNRNIFLIPSQKKQPEPTTIEIAGFKHITGFPTNYLISIDDRIMKISEGAVIPATYTDRSGKEITITEDEAKKMNYERLEREIKELLNTSV
ncbi:MAG: thioredoxin family protein [Winogradskyella sp.]|uniref:TlpA family protein disulfide reductase n=1 Tax=Winogradskyella sp. TaxID=1883156 RepID=UPI0025F51C7C|nr:thioredoxin family protein [Winogradskyella sp.]NRB84899.1 thioredoxin family protein [Winogradskyella sp.]